MQIDPISPERLGKELRFLRGYAILSAIAFAALFVLALSPADRGSDVIEAQRINILNADGSLSLAISGQGRLPGPTFEGREYPQELSGGRVGASGMIFFNQRGDEVGGLTYQGDVTENGYAASGGITFDQFRQDQVVSLQYQDNGVQRSAGVNVWDRSTDVGLGEILELVDARSRASGAELDSLNAVLEGWAGQGLATHRIFMGSRNRTATLQMRDTQGRARIRLSVDSLDVARLEFLDAEGGVTRAFPD